jgi:hypothetical protein
MVLNNPNDPLHLHLHNNQKELFVRLCAAANGFSTEDVIGAAGNMLVNALRQAHSTDRAVMASYDEWVARFKGILMDHYDRASGKRKSGIFPFDQVIQPPHLVADDKIFTPR